VNLKWLALLVSSGVVFASEGSGETDIIPRVVNFLIFAGIIYYLLADFTKNFFSKRSEGIMAKLNSIQEKVKESKQQKEEAILKVKKAERIAEEIIATAKKEALMISENINKSLENDLALLSKHYEEQVGLENRKMKRAVVVEVLQDTFKDGGVSINENDFVNIILKKVA